MLIGPEVSRRRRGKTTATADYTQLQSDIASAGATLLALYDVRSGLTVATGVVTAWTDVLGLGPSLTPTASPTFDGTYVVTNGTSQFFLGTSTYWNTLAGVGALFAVTQLPTLASTRCVCGIAASTGGTYYRLNTSPNSSTSLQMDNATVNSVFTLTGRSGVQVLHGWADGTNLNSVAGSGTAGSAVGTNAAVTPGRLHIAASGAGTLLFADLHLRAVGVIKGTYNSAARSAVNAWAAANHGASL